MENKVEKREEVPESLRFRHILPDQVVISNKMISLEFVRTKRTFGNQTTTDEHTH